MYHLIEPLNGGDQDIVSEEVWNNWIRKTPAPHNSPLPSDQRISYGSNVWRSVGTAEEESDLRPVKGVRPNIPTGLPTPILPTEHLKEVQVAPTPILPELDPSGAPVSQPGIEEVKRGPGRPAKVKA